MIDFSKRKSVDSNVIRNDYIKQYEEQQKKLKKQQEEAEKNKGISGWAKNLFDTSEIKKISKDGFQASDILDYSKVVRNTITNTGVNIGKGILQTGEGIGDYFAYQTASGLQKLGVAKDYMEEVKKSTTDNLVDKIPTKKGDLYGSSTDAILQGVGNSIGNLAMGQVGGKVLTYGSMYLSSKGSAMGEKYQEIDNTIYNLNNQLSLTKDEKTRKMIQNQINDLSTNKDKYVQVYGSISGISETLSEMLFGGVAKGVTGITGLGTGAEDDIIRGLTKNMREGMLKTLVSSGISATGEGLEEVISDFGTAVANKLTTAKDEDLMKLFTDQDLLQDFLNGAMSSVITQTPSAYRSVRTGTNYVTGYTDTEQKIVNQLVEETYQKYKEDNINVKKSDVRNEVEDMFNNGGIRVEDIQRLTNKDMFDNLSNTKNELQKLQNQYNSKQNQLNKLNASPEQQLVNERKINKLSKELETLQQKINDTKNNIDTQTIELEKASLESSKNKIGDLSDFIARSYQDRSQRYENGGRYQIDQETYDKANDNVKDLLDSASKNVGNTYAERKFVNAVANMSSKSGVMYQFTTTKELIDNKLIPKGRFTNGMVVPAADGNKILINADSVKKYMTIFGHETTHLLEASKNYEAYQKLLKEYAKDQYDALYNEFKELYKGVTNNIDAEVTAELTGRLLFEDKNFIRRLTENQTIFDKVKNLISDLIVTFKGTEEEKKLRKLEKTFLEMSKEINRKSKVEENKYALVNTKYSTPTLKQRERINKAEEQYQKGLNDDKIWLNTGVRKNSDNSYTYYVDDLKFKKNLDFVRKGKYYFMDEIFEGELLDTYKELSKRKVMIDDIINQLDDYEKQKPEEVKRANKIVGAVMDDGNLFINSGNIDSTKKATNYIAHEVQHMIQDIESGNAERTNYWVIDKNGNAYYYGKTEQEAKKEYRNNKLEIEAELNRVLNAMEKNQRYNIPLSFIEREVKNHYNESSNSINTNDFIDFIIDKWNNSTKGIDNNENILVQGTSNSNRDVKRTWSKYDAFNNSRRTIENERTNSENDKLPFVKSTSIEGTNNEQNNSNIRGVDNTPFSNEAKYSLSREGLERLAEESGDSYSSLEANLTPYNKDRDLSTSKIIDNVKEYFRTGEFPQQSDLSQYYYSLSNIKGYDETKEYLNKRYNESNEGVAYGLEKLNEQAKKWFNDELRFYQEEDETDSDAYKEFMRYFDNGNDVTAQMVNDYEHQYNDREGWYGLDKELEELKEADNNAIEVSNMLDEILNKLGKNLDIKVAHSDQSNSAYIYIDNDYEDQDFSIRISDHHIPSTKKHGSWESQRYDRNFDINQRYNIDKEVNNILDELKWQNSNKNSLTTDNQGRELSQEDKLHRIVDNAIWSYGEDGRFDTDRDEEMLLDEIYNEYKKALGRELTDEEYEEVDNTLSSFYKDGFYVADDSYSLEEYADAVDKKLEEAEDKLYDYGFNMEKSRSIYAGLVASRYFDKDGITIRVGDHENGNGGEVLTRNELYNMSSDDIVNFVLDRYKTKGGNNIEDNQGRILSRDQQEYFKDSKVRDENGALQVMYHGTPNGTFNVFKPASYFSSNKEYASGYEWEGASSISYNKVTTQPRTYEVYLNVTNPFTLTNPIAKDIYINEYIKGGNSAYFDPYTDYTDTINNQDEIDWTEGVDLTEWLMENHPEFDGLYLDEGGDGGYGNAEYRWRGISVVPFNSNQIKNVDNTNPTSDDDIRFSLSQRYNYNEDVAPTSWIGSRGDMTDEINSLMASTNNDDYKYTSNDIAPTKLNYIPINPTKEEAYDEKNYPNMTTTEAKEKGVFQVSDEKKTQVKGMWDDFQEKFVNRNRYVDELSRKTGNKKILINGDMANSSMGEANFNINNKQTDINGNEIGKGVKEIFKPSRDAGLYKAFNDYLFNKSNIERHQYDKGSLVPANVSEQLVKDYEAEYPQFVKWSKDVYSYYDKVLQNQVDAGLTSKESKEFLRQRYENYVPFYEMMDGKRYFNDRGELKVVSTIKSARGGADQSKVMGMEDAMQRQTYVNVNAIRLNNLYAEIVKTLGGDEKLTEPERQYVADLSQSLYQDGDKFYLTAYIDGTAKTSQISEDMYKELSRVKENNIKALEEKYAPVTEKIQRIGNIRRNLITSWNPVFWTTNAIKDVQDAAFNSKYLNDFMKELPSSYTEIGKAKTKEARQFLALYGNDGLYGNYEGNKKGIVGKISNLNETIELAPRFAEFKASLKNGCSVEEAIYNAREVTTNFGRGGYITKALNRNGFTFLNASVQGLDKQFRNLIGANGVKGYTELVTKAVLMSMLPAIFNHLAYGSGDDKDEDYEALPDYIKDNYYLIKTEDNTFIRIPKGRISAVIGSASRRTIEAIEGEEDAFKGWGSNAWSQVGVDGSSNNMIAPLYQAFGSKNGTAWYGDDIVPTRLQDKPKAEQYDASTDSLSKFIGKTLNISPYKVNYVLDQYTGGIGDILLPMMTEETKNGSDNPIEYLIAPIKDKYVVNSTDDNKYAGEFYDTLDKLKVQNNSEYATDEDRLKYKYASHISSELSSLYAQRREVQSDSSLSNKEKYAKVQEIQSQINELAKLGYESYDKVTINGNYAIVNDDIGYYKDKDGEWKKESQSDIELVSTMGMNDVERSKYYEIKQQISSIESGDKDRKAKVTQAITNSGLNDVQKSVIYSKYYSSEKTMNNITNANIDFNTYANAEIKIDELKNTYSNKNGYSTDQRRSIVQQYINSLNLDIGQKLIMQKVVGGYSVKSYQNYLYDYIDQLDLSANEKQELFNSLF